MGYGYYLNDQRFWRGVIEVLEASWEATEKRFAKYNKLNKNIMEEKKTKKMTKAEAFEWLKGKKMNAKDKDRVVQMKMFDCGIKWRCGESTYYNSGIFLLIDNEGFLSHCSNDEEYWKRHAYEEISVDDILSIEIVEEKKDDERKGEILDEIAKLGEKISDLIEEYDGDIIIEIDQYEVLLRNSGDILYRK